MKAFNASLASIRNDKGDFEPMAALRGYTSYEIAKANGYTGSEETWVQYMTSDGWIGRCAEIDSAKPNYDEVFVKDHTIDDTVKTNYGFETTDTPTPIDIFSKISSDLSDLKSGRLRIKIDTYLGSNGAAEYNAVRIAPGFKPLLLWIRPVGNEQTYGHDLTGPWICGETNCITCYRPEGSYNYTAKLKWDDESVSFWNDNSPVEGLNSVNVEYRYVVIGIDLTGDEE